MPGRSPWVGMAIFFITLSESYLMASSVPSYLITCRTRRISPSLPTLTVENRSLHRLSLLGRFVSRFHLRYQCRGFLLLGIIHSSMTLRRATSELDPPYSEKSRDMFAMVGVPSVHGVAVVKTSKLIESEEGPCSRWR